MREEIKTLGALRAYIAGLPDELKLFVDGTPYNEIGLVVPVFEHYGLYKNGDEKVEDQFIVFANNRIES